LTVLGNVSIGGTNAAKVMGIINVSPESFYKASVRAGDEEIVAAAKEMQQDGVHVIDVGAMSTAPYLETIIPAGEEIKRLTRAIKAIKGACNLPVSADTPRAEVAREAITAGADGINDVTGLKYDSNMVSVIAKAGVPAIIGAYSKIGVTGRISGTIKALNESIDLARKAGIADNNIIIDPSIGFFRKEGKNPFFTEMSDMPWYTRDIEAIRELRKLDSLKKPICVSASRKSFIGHLLDLKAEDRLAPSLACEVVAALNGASIIRTHNVKETAQALMMLQLLMP
jgi:dihydropteroate synthase